MDDPLSAALAEIVKHVEPLPTPRASMNAQIRREHIVRHLRQGAHVLALQFAKKEPAYIDAYHESQREAIIRIYYEAIVSRAFWLATMQYGFAVYDAECPNPNPFMNIPVGSVRGPERPHVARLQWDNPIAGGSLSPPTNIIWPNGEKPNGW